jgi:hypothetical protein
MSLWVALNGIACKLFSQSRPSNVRDPSMELCWRGFGRTAKTASGEAFVDCWPQRIETGVALSRGHRGAAGVPRGTLDLRCEVGSAPTPADDPGLSGSTTSDS